LFLFQKGEIKLKEWLRKKLKQFLGINEVNESLTKLHNIYNYNSGLLENYNSTSKEILKKNEYILDQFNLAADIYPSGREESWAVICIKGKPEYVRFVRLSNNDMREVHYFLKRFEGTNRIIDSPFKFF
jgi:hypothetical protein